MLRVFVEDERDVRRDITHSPDGQKASDYVERMRRYGLLKEEIEDDVGGWEDRRGAHDGLIPWACGAYFERVDVLLLYAPD